jgi:hypothetical protein
MRTISSTNRWNSAWGRLKRIVASDFPRAVRTHAAYVWIVLAMFAVPTLVLGCLV